MSIFVLCVCVLTDKPEVFMCVEVKPLRVFLPLLSLYDGMELMMACRYFSCSRVVESAWEGTAENNAHTQTCIFCTISSVSSIQLMKLFRYCIIFVTRTQHGDVARSKEISFKYLQWGRSGIWKNPPLPLHADLLTAAGQLWSASSSNKRRGIDFDGSSGRFSGWLNQGCSEAQSTGQGSWGTHKHIRFLYVIKLQRDIGQHYISMLLVSPPADSVHPVDSGNPERLILWACQAVAEGA